MNDDYPTNWSKLELGDFAKATGGSRFPPAAQGESDGDYPFYKVSDMNLPGNERFMSVANNWITEATRKKIKAKTFPAGSVIFPKIGAAVATNKKRLLTQESIVDNNVMAVVVAEPNQCLSRYLLFWFEAIDLRDFSNSGALPSIPAHRVHTMHVPLPPLPEQKKIAHILSTVQRAIEAQEQIIQTTTELKKTLMHKLFTEGLHNEPQKQTEIGLVPESWTSITLGELCEKPSGALQTGPFGSQLHKNEYQDEGVGVVNPTHLKGNQINHENIPHINEDVAQRLGKHRLRKFDILFARRGEIGRQALVTELEETWVCGTGCFLVRANKPFLDNRFLALYFATEPLVKWLHSHAAGAIMPNLNNTIMRRLPVFYPSLDIQYAIRDTLNAAEQKTVAAGRKVAALQNLFRTLLHELMTAKTRVHLNLLPKLEYEK